MQQGEGAPNTSLKYEVRGKNSFCHTGGERGMYEQKKEKKDSYMREGKRRHNFNQKEGRYAAPAREGGLEKEEKRKKDASRIPNICLMKE